MTIKQDNLKIQNQLKDRLEDFNNLSREKDKLEELLKATRTELQNFELFKQQVDEDKLAAIEDLENTLKAHYEKTIELKLKSKDDELDKKFEACRKEYESHLENMKNKIQLLENGNDEIKNDYCQLAAEKETIERHYENMEAKVKRNRFIQL